MADDNGSLAGLIAELKTVEQAAEMIGVSRRTVDRWIERDEFIPPYHTYGTIRLWRAPAIRAFIARRQGDSDETE